jgi:hypothetical protein
MGKHVFHIYIWLYMYVYIYYIYICMMMTYNMPSITFWWWHILLTSLMIVFPSMMINAQFPTLDFRVYHGVPHEDGRICRGEDQSNPEIGSLSRSHSVTQMATLGQVIVFRLDRLVVSKCLWHFPTRMINLTNSYFSGGLNLRNHPISTVFAGVPRAH